MEEWFHILDLPKSHHYTNWESLPSRVEVGLARFMDLLSRHNTTCTFFILGWIAKQYPDLVRKIDSLGHEIASHGYGHELIYKQGPERFRQDIRQAKTILENIVGKEIMGYRGPGFSIKRTNLWAFDIIAEEGFRYDATIYPGKHGHGGIPSFPSKPFILSTLGGQHLEEYPITVMNMGVCRAAFSGGGYFRILPFFLISQLLRRLNHRNIPVMAYFHPRDLDPAVPRLSMPWIRRFKSYVNLSGSFDKLDRMLQTHLFASIRDWRNGRREALPTFSLKDLL